MQRKKNEKSTSLGPITNSTKENTKLILEIGKIKNMHPIY
jgi:hypothetical protein